MTWSVITTEPRREFVAGEGLARRGILAYCPARQERVRAAPNTARPWRLVARPLFPGYVFAKAGPAVLAAVREISGCSGYLRSGEGPATLSEAAIALVRQVEISLSVAEPKLPYPIGCRVRVAEDGNPWTGYEGVVDRIDKADRVVIDLICGTSNWAVSMPVSALREAG